MPGFRVGVPSLDEQREEADVGAHVDDVRVLRQPDGFVAAVVEDLAVPSTATTLKSPARPPVIDHFEGRSYLGQLQHLLIVRPAPATNANAHSTHTTTQPGKHR
jgi:hypothetical protein